MGQYFIPREYHPIDEIRLVYEDGILVGWYRPDVDPEIEELKAKISKMKRHMEHLMKFPQNHCIYCEFRDRECGFECEPKYHGAWGENG